MLHFPLIHHLAHLCALVLFAAGFQAGFRLVPILFCAAIHFTAKFEDLVSASLHYGIYNVRIRIARN